MNMSIEEKLAAAQARLALAHPFLASFSLSGGWIVTDNKAIFGESATAATDGTNFYWHPNFIEKHSIPELVGVWAHEIYHKIFKHHLWDRKVWESRKLNIAADFAINGILQKQQFTLPKDALLSDKFTGKTEEQIYRELEKNMTKFEMPRWGVSLEACKPDGSALSEEEKQQIASQIDRQVVAAAQAAKMAGKLPAEIQELVDKLLEPEIDYEDIIYQALTGGKPSGYSMRRPSKSLLENYGIFGPGRNRRGAGVVGIGMDVSGSISTTEAENFLGIFNAIQQVACPEKVVIIQFDAKVTDVKEYDGGQEIPHIEIKGRGGTDFSPQFQYILDNGLRIDQYLVLTDMCGPFPAEPPMFPVTWLATTKADKAPFGRTVHFKLKQNG